MVDLIHLGSFNVTSNKLRVTDPCYNRGCSLEVGEISNVMNGKWLASIEKMPDSMTGLGDRISKIIVKNNNGVPKRKNSVEELIGVDSGQAGFFCDSGYPIDDVGDFADKESFYGRVCTITLSDRQAGILDFGAVSSSGFGDGGYLSNYWTDADGFVVQAEIIFISERDLDNEDDEL